MPAAGGSESGEKGTILFRLPANSIDFFCLVNDCGGNEPTSATVRTSLVIGIIEVAGFAQTEANL